MTSKGPKPVQLRQEKLILVSQEISNLGQGGLWPP